MIETQNKKKIIIKLKEKISHLTDPLPKKIQLKLKSENDLSTVPLIIKKPRIVLKSKQSPIEKLNQYLDEKFKHHLMYIKNSWSEVDYKIRIDSNNQECWWDLEILLIHFAEQLNSSCMSNPSPQWPSNPFNRQPFTKSQLLKLNKQITELKIPVNYMVKELFNYLQTKLRYVSMDKFTGCFIGYVSHNYRYKLINCKDSQDNYIGYWEKKNVPLSLFEQRFNELKQIAPVEYGHGDHIIERVEYTFMKEIIDSMPPQTIDLTSIALETL